MSALTNCWTSISRMIQGTGGGQDEEEKKEGRPG
jgi:hypothetical protein